jgi:acyl-CoA thioesterase
VTAFAVDSAVRADPSVAGRFHAHLPVTWAAPRVPQGGLSLATTTRAMQAALATPMPLRSVSCVFAAPVEPGPVEIDVTVLRTGRSVAQTLATARTPGRDAGLTAIAVFGVERPGFEFTDLARPDFPDPASIPSFREIEPPDDFARDPFPIWVHHVEGRPVTGHPPWEHHVSTSSLREQYQRLDEVPRRPDGTVDPLALIVLCDTMPGAVQERLGSPLDLPWYGPSADLTVHLAAPPRSDWILLRNRARFALDGYASVEVELWDEAVGLVAYATQTMIFVFEGDHPTGEARKPLDLRRS